MLTPLVQQITINRPTFSKDASGGGVAITQLTPVYQDLPVFICPATADIIQLYTQNDIKVSHTIYTDCRLSVKAGDQIAYGSRTFTLKGYRDEGELGIIISLDCWEILGGGP